MILMILIDNYNNNDDDDNNNNYDNDNDNENYDDDNGDYDDDCYGSTKCHQMRVDHLVTHQLLPTGVLTTMDTSYDKNICIILT